MLFAWIQNFTVKTRITGLAGLAIIGFIIIFSVDTFSSSVMMDASERADRNAALELNVSQMEAESLMVRRREKDFFLRLDASYIEKYNEDMNSTIALLQKAKGLSDDSAGVKAANDLEGILDRHRAQFMTVSNLWKIIGLDTKSGLYADMQVAVHGIEDELPKYKIDALVIKMLMMRRHEKDFMMRVANKDSSGKYSNGPKYAGRVAVRAKEFIDILNASNIRAAAKEDLQLKLGAYVDAFDDYADKRMQIVTETATLSDIYKETDPHFEMLRRVAKKGNEEAKAAYGEAKDFAEFMLVAIIVLFGALSIVVAFIVIRSTIPAIKAMETTLGVIADGNLDVDVPNTQSKDEIGAMARAVLVLRDNGKKQRELEAEMKRHEEEAEKQEQARLESEQAAEREKAEEEAKRVAYRQERADKVNALIENFDQAIQSSIGELEASATQMQGTATSMVDVADNTGRQAAAVSEASEQMDGNVATMAAAIEEFSHSISEANGQVQSATKLSQGAVAASQEGEASIEKLSDASKTIEAVVSLITDIAEQTNLLALNATIEAARAGDAGRGFAVVASEVKNLASQTAKATEDITKQINEMQALSGGAVSSMGTIRDGISELNQTMLGISAAIEEQEAATSEISRNVQFTSEGTQRVTSEIGQVASNVDVTKNSSNDVMTASTQLESLAANIKAEIQTFLSDVKAV